MEDVPRIALELRNTVYRLEFSEADAAGHRIFLIVERRHKLRKISRAELGRDKDGHVPLASFQLLPVWVLLHLELREEDVEAELDEVVGDEEEEDEGEV